MRHAIPLLLTAAVAAGGGWYWGTPAERKMERRAVESAASQKPVAAKTRAPLSVSKLDPQEVQARLLALVDSPQQDGVERRLLMARWVAADLAAAKEWALNLPRGDGSFNDFPSILLTEFFAAWSRLDPTAAMDEGLKLTGGSRSSTACRAVVSALGNADPEVISATLAKLPQSKSRWDPYYVLPVIKQLAVRDAAAARQLALSLQGPRGDSAARAVAQVMARTDPQAALAWAQAFPQESARSGAVEDVLKEWAGRDPAAVGPLLWQKTPGQPDKFATEAAVAALRSLSASNPAEAAAFLEKFIPPAEIKANLRSFYDLLSSNPDAPGAASLLCACVNRLSPEELKDARVYGQGWPMYEVARPVWDRLLAEPDSPGRRFLAGQVAERLATYHPAKVIREAMKLPDAQMREELLTAAFPAVPGIGSDLSYFARLNDYQADIADLRAAVETMPASVQALGAAHLAKIVAEGQPAAAAQLVTQYPALGENADFMRKLAGRFMETAEPSAARGWVNSLTSEQARASASEGIADTWYRQDSEAASQWVNSLAPGTVRDAAAAKLAAAARDMEPDSALAWASSVQDTARRAEATKSIVRYWAKYDPALVEESIQGMSLPGPEKQELLRILNQSR